MVSDAAVRLPVTRSRLIAAAGWLLDLLLLVAFAPLWLAAGFAYAAVWFVRFGWQLADDLFGVI